MGEVPRRPVSRVLYPAFVKGRAAVIYLGLPLPTGSSGQPGDGPDALVPLLGLAPDGVCLASDVAAEAVSSYLTISPLPRCGRCVSVALSVGSPRPAVSGHPVRWSSDFPLPLRAAGAATARPPCVFIVDAKDGGRQLRANLSDPSSRGRAARETAAVGAAWRRISLPTPRLRPDT